ncbi:adenylate/guanylate cyclase domain-containing protein [Mycolicibacterium tusciae]|uniref:adenylate/guanylate cyclase domain-containing protein n=1 Tax=Mycolicibacterium tusciae TaxID=75922 RepID=UPI00024A1EB6|nr:adenylate/guanylate cyclase domain-containing protein [Mycolicibacterium tusciae]
MVTFLMAGVEGPAPLWEGAPEEMFPALPWLRATFVHFVALNGGVMRAGQGSSDSFVVVFGYASDAVACALYLQLEPLDPFALRIGLHSVDTRSAERGDLVAMNGAAWLRDIACGGQTVLSPATASLAADRLPPGASLKDLGDHRDGQCTPVELCHPGLRKYT